MVHNRMLNNINAMLIYSEYKLFPYLELSELKIEKLNLDKIFIINK